MHFYSRFEVPTPVLPLLAAAMLLCTTMQVQAAKSASVASGKNGIVVAGEKRAADIGTQVLEKGGNAADAATASLLALSVTKIGAFTFAERPPSSSTMRASKRPIRSGRKALPRSIRRPSRGISRTECLGATSVLQPCRQSSIYASRCSSSMGPFRLKKR